MTTPTTHILNHLESISTMYNRLILLVGPSGKGKTRVLREVEGKTDAEYINVNLKLSEQLLDLTERQRALQVAKLTENIVENVKKEIRLLDNIEILFDPELKLDPLRLLKNISRNYPMVVAWNGTVNNGYLTYAEPDHREYRRYPDGELLIVKTE
jgi:ABC-type branched-subunit amino acid transport system ATPase component